MSLVVAATGLGGFLASISFLAMGVDALPLRYFLSVIVAYVLFIGCIRLWIHAIQRVPRAELNPPDGVDLIDTPGSSAHIAGGGPHFSGDGGSFSGGGGKFSGGGAHASFRAHVSPGSSTSSGGGIGDAFDISLDEVIVALALGAAVFSAVIVAVYVIVTAPAFFAEVFVDAVLSVGLYRRLAHREPRHWLGGVLRRTALAFIAVAIFFVVAGIALQWYAPEATSIGGVWQHYLSVHR